MYSFIIEWCNTHEGGGKKGVCMGICSRRGTREKSIEKKWLVIIRIGREKEGLLR